MKRILASILALSAAVCAMGNRVLAYEQPAEAVNAVLEERISPRYSYIRSLNTTVNSYGEIEAVLHLQDYLDYSMTLAL